MQLATFLETRHEAAKTQDTAPLSAQDALLGAQLAHFFCESRQAAQSTEELVSSSGSEMDDMDEGMDDDDEPGVMGGMFADLDAGDEWKPKRKSGAGGAGGCGGD